MSHEFSTISSFLRILSLILTFSLSLGIICFFWVPFSWLFWSLCFMLEASLKHLLELDCALCPMWWETQAQVGLGDWPAALWGDQVVHGVSTQGPQSQQLQVFLGTWVSLENAKLLLLLLPAQVRPLALGKRLGQADLSGCRFLWSLGPKNPQLLSLWSLGFHHCPPLSSQLSLVHYSRNKVPVSCQIVEGVLIGGDLGKDYFSLYRFSKTPPCFQRHFPDSTPIFPN